MDNYVRVIVNRDPSCKLPDLDKRKFMVPHDVTMGQFFYVIRKRLKLEHYKALIFFINGSVLAPVSDCVSLVHDKFKKKDNILYLTYTEENTFG